MVLSVLLLMLWSLQLQTCFTMSNAGSSELNGGSLFDPSFWYSFTIGYVCSATGIIFAFMCFCVPWPQLKKAKRKFMSSSVRRRNIHAIKANQVPKLLLCMLLLKKGNQEVSRVLNKLISSISFMELCKATDYFNMTNVIGTGRTGMVYKATLSNGSKVAVKRLYDSKLFETKFALEIVILQRFKHKNLVDLLEFCTERKQRILVYEFMPNGKLSDWLHPLQNEAFPLDWPIRLKIALGLARGLCFLHHCCNWKILHFGISSEHVLLDKNFEPKLWNFRSAELMKENQKKLGKKDVYDFGIVLMELITGKKHIEMNGNFNVIDSYVSGKGFDEQISCLVKVAVDCIQFSPHQRPSMVDVYKYIERLWEGYETDD
ncbi:brassinosteroid insensitive 1-associated receptor kinase 1 [Vigna unguiculata]|uniref:Brassinosteroid insensitive 1-associated receptor kinase 1 n=1 Tax=Vigna unguiculata TaxID=3917 RepID=A0A4D6L6Y7_VIGUN|nr:brassinosteroid insensitive 1-associated receptor kinase 1 [Vigna unguiculata]QCD84237.1 brassinosteroid insensitive 1-associated receptor kinase 1 [Vigna unguiculata]